MAFKAAFIIEEDHYVLFKCLILLSDRQFLVQVLKYQVFALVIANDIPDTYRIVICMRKKPEPLNMAFMCFIRNEDHFHIGVILPCGNVDYYVF